MPYNAYKIWGGQPLPPSTMPQCVQGVCVILHCLPNHACQHLLRQVCCTGGFCHTCCWEAASACCNRCCQSCGSPVLAAASASMCACSAILASALSASSTCLVIDPLDALTGHCMGPAGHWTIDSYKGAYFLFLRMHSSVPRQVTRVLRRS